MTRARVFGPTFKLLKRTAWCTILGVFTASPAAHAQGPGKSVVGHIGGGYAEPVGRAGDYFSPGWNISGGAMFHVGQKRSVGLRIDLGFSRFDAENQVIESASGATTSRTDDGYASMMNLSIDAIHDFGGNGHVGGYIGAGIGGYSQYWNLTQTVLVSGLYCDPIWGVCVISTAGDVIKNSGRLTKLGYNFSLAISFPLEKRGEVYVEGRYHRTDSNPATEFVPVVVGYRW